MRNVCKNLFLRTFFGAYSIHCCKPFGDTVPIPMSLPDAKHVLCDSSNQNDPIAWELFNYNAQSVPPCQCNFITEGQILMYSLEATYNK